MSKTSKGFAWSFVERFLYQGAYFIISIILARLIAPESYGLIVMSNIFITFSNLFIEAGFSKALMQKLNRTELDYNTVFIFNIFLAILIYTILYCFAPYISSFYDQPKLTSVIRVLTLNLIIASFTVVPRAILNINLDFRSLARISFLSISISGAVGVIMAYHGFEVWALVAQALLMEILMTIGLMYKSIWRPKLQFSFNSFKELFGYGSKLLFNAIFSSLYVEGTNLLIGKFYNSSQLAYYNRAFQFSSFPSTNIVGILNRVSFPLECEAQKSPEDLKRVYLRNLHLSNFICLPLLTIIGMLSESIVRVVLTEKWLPTADYLFLFSINFIPFATLNEIANVISAVGRSDVIMKGTIYRRLLSFGVLFVTLFYGVRAICLGLIFCSFMETVIMTYLLYKTLKYSYVEQLRVIADVIISSALICFLLFVLKIYIDIPIHLLIIGVLASSLVYIALARVLHMPEYDYLKCVVLDFIKK